MITWESQGTILSSTRCINDSVYILSVTSCTILGGYDKVLCNNPNCTISIVRLSLSTGIVVYERQILLPVNRCYLGVPMVCYPLMKEEDELLILETRLLEPLTLTDIPSEYEVHVIDLSRQPLSTLVHCCMIVPGYSRPLSTTVYYHEDAILMLESFLLSPPAYQLQLSMCSIVFDNKKLYRTSKAVRVLEQGCIVSHSIDDQVYLSYLGISGKLYILGPRTTYTVDNTSCSPKDSCTVGQYNYLVSEKNGSSIVSLHCGHVPVCHIVIASFIPRGIRVHREWGIAMILNDNELALLSYAPTTLFEHVFRYIIEQGIDIPPDVSGIGRIKDRMTRSDILT